MFRTVFFAVLLALFVYNLFKNPDLLELVRKIIKPLLIIGFVWGLILLWIVLIDAYSDEAKEILIVILWLVAVWLVASGIIYLKVYLKYRKRKKLGLIKEGVKCLSFLDEKFEKERYDKLTKKEKEIEDNRASRWPKVMFYCLISIPVLLLLVFVIFFIVEAIKDGF